MVARLQSQLLHILIISNNFNEILGSLEPRISVVLTSLLPGKCFEFPRAYGLLLLPLFLHLTFH